MHGIEHRTDRESDLGNKGINFIGKRDKRLETEREVENWFQPSCWRISSITLF